MIMNTPMTITALDLSRYLINKCTVESEPISNLQLQKILYYIQKDFLVNINRTAFFEDIEAWKFGPVVPEVYYHFCGFGAMKINRNYEQIQIGDPETSERVDSIVIEKRSLNPWDLVQDTHKQGGAWDNIFAQGKGNRDIIPQDLIVRLG